MGCSAEDAEDAGEAGAEDVLLYQVRAAEEGARLPVRLAVGVHALS